MAQSERRMLCVTLTMIRRAISHSHSETCNEDDGRDESSSPVSLSSLLTLMTSHSLSIDLSLSSALLHSIVDLPYSGRARARSSYETYENTCATMASLPVWAEHGYGFAPRFRRRSHHDMKRCTGRQSRTLPFR
jgi:hypothetical protein